MTSNFLLNNELTYRDRRLKGWGMLRGFVLFCLVCSVGRAGQCGPGELALYRAADLVGGGRGRRGDERACGITPCRPCSSGARDDSGPRKLGAGGGCCLVLRAVLAALLPLSADEAYYWLWSRHLAAGYFDHPPAIAWLIRAGTSLFGDTPLGVRLMRRCAVAARQLVCLADAAG